MDTEILVARHGETDWNLTGRWQGHTDRPLNDNGFMQARELASRLSGSNIDSIYSSDLTRAKTTADIVASATGINNVTVDARLRERNLGTFEGLSSEEICNILGISKRKLTIKEIGVNETIERWESFSERISSAIEDIRHANQGKKILVVAHGGVMSALAMIILNDYETPRRFTNGDFLRLTYREKWSVELPEEMP